jgi:hypothetical protein
MAVTAKVYYKAITSMVNEEVDWATDTIKVALFTSSLNSSSGPSQSADQYFDAAPYTSNQCPATGNYSTGGATLASKTEAYASNVKQFDAADTTWSTSTITARYAVVYDDTPSSNKPLLSYVDFGQDVSSSGGNFTITWDSTGVFTVTVS